MIPHLPETLERLFKLFPSCSCKLTVKALWHYLGSDGKSLVPGCLLWAQSLNFGEALGILQISLASILGWRE